MSARISYLLPGNERKKNEPVCLVAIDAGRKLEIPVLFFGWQQTRESIFSSKFKNLPGLVVRWGCWGHPCYIGRIECTNSVSRCRNKFPTSFVMQETT
jgi:hypothetical protein